MQMTNIDRELLASDDIDLPVVAEDDELFYEPLSSSSKSQTGDKQLLFSKLPPASFASTAASFPASSTLPSTPASSWKSLASLRSVGSVVVSDLPQAPVGDIGFGTDRKYLGPVSSDGSSVATEQRNIRPESKFAKEQGESRFALGASGPLLDRERQQGQHLLDVEASDQENVVASAQSDAQVVRAPVAWRVACPVILLACVAGAVIVVLVSGGA